VNSAIVSKKVPCDPFLGPCLPRPKPPQPEALGGAETDSRQAQPKTGCQHTNYRVARDTKCAPLFWISSEFTR